MMIRSASFLIGLLLIIHLGFAQTLETRFRHLTGTAGVSLGRINAISQDRQGMIWFSDETNHCVTRFDGSHMTRFVHDPLDNNSLGGSHPECITPDSTGIIWIGLYGSGLDRFDPETNTFTHFRHHPDDPESLSNDTVSNILIDHLGVLWVGSDGGVDKMDQKTGKFTHYRNNKQDPASLSYDKVRALYEDRQGTIWVGTGYVWTRNNTGGLNRFDRKTGTFTRFLHDPKNPHSLLDNKVRAIFEDSRGTFWVGTAGDGLHTLDRKTGLFERHSYDRSKPEKLSRPATRRWDDHITFITEDGSKNIWIGTFVNGVNQYDPVTRRVTHFGGDSEQSDAFHDISVWAACPSSDGMIYIGTQEDNTYQVEPVVRIRRQEVSPYNTTNGFFEESPTVFWFGTFNGAFRKDLKNGQVTILEHDPNNLNSLSGNDVFNMHKDARGNLWFGTKTGLNSYDPESKTFTRFQNNPSNPESLIGDWVLVMTADNDSGLWIGTDGGLELLNLETMRFTHFRRSQGDTTSLADNVVTCILPDKANGLWAGNWNGGGINHLNRQTGKFKHYLRGESVVGLYRDMEDILWVASTNKLHRYNPSSDSFSHFDAKISEIRALIGDNENNLWIASTSSLFRINPERTQIIRLGSENGILSGSINYLDTYKKKDGELFFGGFAGYYSFYPAKIRLKSRPVKIMFTNLWVNGNPIRSTSRGPLKKPISVAERIDLNHDQNVFSIGIATIDFSDPATRSMSYKLESYDKTWRPFTAEESVNYFNVPPGQYTFRMRVINQATGVTSEKSLHIMISPPWWRTPWANGIFVIMLGASVYSVHRIQKGRVIRAERERAREKELAQAREIEKAYKDLRITQDQLVQSEKMASLGELTAGIAHEIQNPLNFVNNFSEVNSELIAEMKAEIEKGNLNDVKAIAKSIDENEQKIIFHGKRADAIVKGMLQHSRSSSGVKELTDINALADEYLRLAYHGLRAKDKSFNATMKTEFDGGLGKINVVSQEIGRVILNLITNAFFSVSERKASSKAENNYEPTVTVSTRNLGDKVEVKVRDNGNGIPQKVMDKIFQPFFTTKPAGQGTGLGLSLSYDIIKAHGGQLKVQTKEGEFAEFIVLLPQG